MRRRSRAAAYRFSGLSNSSGVMFSKLPLLRFPSNSEYFSFFSSQVDTFSGKTKRCGWCRGVAPRDKKNGRTQAPLVRLPNFGGEPLAVQRSSFTKRQPAASEGLLPHHPPPVTPDDLISAHNGSRRVAEEDSRTAAACCLAASVFHFFYETSPFEFRHTCRH